MECLQIKQNQNQNLHHLTLDVKVSFFFLSEASLFLSFDTNDLSSAHECVIIALRRHPLNKWLPPFSETRLRNRCKKNESANLSVTEEMNLLVLIPVPQSQVEEPCGLATRINRDRDREE